MNAPRGLENPAWRAEIRVDAAHPALPGHFPSEPIVPGVLLLDEVLHLLGGEADHWRVEQIKFHHVVRPGELLTLLVQRRAEGSYAFEVLSERQIVSTGLLLSHRDAPDAPSPRP